MQLKRLVIKKKIWKHSPVEHSLVELNFLQSVSVIEFLLRFPMIISSISTFSRWKQLTEYEFTASSFDARVVTNLILRLIVKCKEIGLKVRVLIMDMGPCNKAI